MVLIRMQDKTVKQRGYRTYWLRECLNCGKSITSFQDDKIFCNLRCTNERREKTYNVYEKDIKNLLSICFEQLKSEDKFVVI